MPEDDVVDAKPLNHAVHVARPRLILLQAVDHATVPRRGGRTHDRRDSAATIEDVPSGGPNPGGDVVEKPRIGRPTDIPPSQVDPPEKGQADFFWSGRGPEFAEEPPQPPDLERETGGFHHGTKRRTPPRHQAQKYGAKTLRPSHLGNPPDLRVPNNPPAAQRCQPLDLPRERSGHRTCRLETQGLEQ